MANLTNTAERTVGGIQEEVETSKLDVDISRLAFSAIIIMTGLIGIWGLLCVIGGVLSCGNIADLGRGWLAAITG